MFNYKEILKGLIIKINYINMVILFKGTFTETDAVKLKEETLNFELDPNVTK